MFTPGNDSQAPDSPEHIESAKIITISIAHLHQQTIEMLEKTKGDVPEGPSVGIRDEGYLLNSHLGVPDALQGDLSDGRDLPPLIERHPDLTLIRAIARGVGAEWISIDIDGIEYTDILPSYHTENGSCSAPTADGWKDVLGETSETFFKHRMVIPTFEVLEMIEAGQTPTAPIDSPEP